MDRARRESVADRSRQRPPLQASAGPAQAAGGGDWPEIRIGEAFCPPPDRPPAHPRSRAPDNRPDRQQRATLFAPDRPEGREADLGVAHRVDLDCMAFSERQGPLRFSCDGRRRCRTHSISKDIARAADRLSAMVSEVHPSGTGPAAVKACRDAQGRLRQAPWNPGAAFSQCGRWHLSEVQWWSLVWRFPTIGLRLCTTSACCANGLAPVWQSGARS